MLLFTRPSDLRASINQLTITTFDEEKRKAKQRKEATDSAKPSPAKRARTTKVPPKGKVNGRAKGKGKEKEKDDSDSASEVEAEREVEEETYHFIGYVPAHGKVWSSTGSNLDRLRSASSLGCPAVRARARIVGGWTLCGLRWRMKMEKYGGSGSDGSNIRFSLLAIVDDVYKKASDELELLKREQAALKKRMDSSGQARDAAQSAFVAPLGKTFAQDFGARKMDRDLAVMELPEAELVPAWEACVRKANTAKVAVEDELAKAIRSNVSVPMRMRG